MSVRPPGRQGRRTDRGGWCNEVAAQDSEDVQHGRCCVTLDQDVILGSGERAHEGDAGESGESESKKARDKHCRLLISGGCCEARELARLRGGLE